MEINPQAVFTRLQSRIAALEFDNAVLSAALEDLTAQYTALEKEHEQCGKPKASENGHALPVMHQAGEKAG